MSTLWTSADGFTEKCVYGVNDILIHNYKNMLKTDEIYNLFNMLKTDIKPKNTLI